MQKVFFKVLSLLFVLCALNADDYLERDSFKFAPHDLALTEYLAKNKDSQNSANLNKSNKNSRTNLMNLTNPKNPRKDSNKKQSKKLSKDSAKNLKDSRDSQDSRTNQPKNPSKIQPKLLSATPQTPLMQLPSDFDLSAWEQRLLQIITTTNRSSDSQLQGICGVCMLQSFQIVAEFMRYHNSPPTSGGYFFDTAPNTNPFTSFRQRHSILHDTLADIDGYYAIVPGRAASVFLSTMNNAMASAISMLPQYDWSLFGASANNDEINALMQRAINESQVGDMYMAFLLLFLPERETLTGHTVVIVRTSNGIVMIPTNVRGLNLESLRRYMQVATNPTELRARLETRARGRSAILAGLGLLQVRVAPNLPFASALSFSDCSGEGDDRRGNNAIPSAATLNQCASGRCNQ